MKKRVLTVLLCGALMTTMALPAFAADTDASKQDSVTLKAQKASAYTLSIPTGDQNITFGTTDTDTSIGDVTISGNVDVGEIVTVSAVTNALVRTGSTGDSIPFTLYAGAAADQKEFTDTIWNEAQIYAGTTTVPLTVHVTKASWDAAKAGGYTGSIVFSAELTEKVTD